MTLQGAGGARATARRWFVAQAVAGAGWWVAVATAPSVRSATLGEWDPAVLVGPDLLLFVGASLVAGATGRWPWAAVAAGWTVALTGALAGYALVTGQAGWGALLMGVASVGSIAAAATLRQGTLPVGWFFLGPFRFREAAPTTGPHHLARSLRQLVVFWTILLIGLPLLAAWAEDRVGLDVDALDGAAVRWCGVALFVVASAVALWACFSMALVGKGTPLPAATATTLVVAGPYRFVRNPMAATGAVQAIGAGLVLGSWLVIAAAVVGCFAWNVIIRPVEEADLAARFGEPYVAYRSRVRCWVPTFRAPPH